MTMDTSEKREPLLSDEEIEEGQTFLDVDMDWTAGARSARTFYEAKIASGELRVTVKVRGIQLPPANLMWGCERCKRPWTKMDQWCPGCGAQIIDP